MVLARKLGLERPALVSAHPETGRIPFESQRRFGASFNRHGDTVVAHVKGAAQTLVEMCANIDAEAILERETEMARAGLRVLGVAAGEVDEAAAQAQDADLEGLRFLGPVGLIDPVRAEVPDAVDRCHSAGVDVRMITATTRPRPWRSPGAWGSPEPTPTWSPGGHQCPGAGRVVRATSAEVRWLRRPRAAVARRRRDRHCRLRTATPSCAPQDGSASTRTPASGAWKPVLERRAPHLSPTSPQPV